jgi:catechol 2,3-dioxygenase-like lactoylglutathione lyase family enzyme
MQILGISHVVIATPDLDRTGETLNELLGLEFGETIDGRYFEKGENRQPAKSRLSPAGIEIMMPTDDSHPQAEFLEERGPSVFIIQLRVADVEEATEELAERGIEPVDIAHYEDEDGYYLTEHIYSPSDFDGVMFGLLEYHTPHPVERPPLSSVQPPES